ncbi:hypothetical protein VNO78_30970 [Psophocarpus tetragonolobus]|uniref:Uncharacterized protein n=1 Tax=Psophocarpus tetragonolobus TaxID=3891 RepID=A0AAN9RYC9_PSOTE
MNNIYSHFRCHTINSASSSSMGKTHTVKVLICFYAKGSALRLISFKISSPFDCCDFLPMQFTEEGLNSGSTAWIQAMEITVIVFFRRIQPFLCIHRYNGDLATITLLLWPLF